MVRGGGEGTAPKLISNMKTVRIQETNGDIKVVVVVVAVQLALVRMMCKGLGRSYG